MPNEQSNMCQSSNWLKGGLQKQTLPQFFCSKFSNQGPLIFVPIIRLKIINIKLCNRSVRACLCCQVDKLLHKLRVFHQSFFFGALPNLPVTNELIEPVISRAIWRVEGSHEGLVGVHDALGPGAGRREGQVDDVVFERHLEPLRGTLAVVFKKLAANTQKAARLKFIIKWWWRWGGKLA